MGGLIKSAATPTHTITTRQSAPRKKMPYGGVSQNCYPSLHLAETHMLHGFSEGQQRVAAEKWGSRGSTFQKPPFTRRNCQRHTGGCRGCTFYKPLTTTSIDRPQDAGHFSVFKHKLPQQVIVFRARICKRIPTKTQVTVCI